MTQDIDRKEQSEVERLVELYDLQPHPEGGWFKETFKSTVHCQIHMIDEKGVYSSAVLGSSLEHAEARYGVLVPAEVWLAAELTNGGAFSLISCMVAPGFEWKGFEMGKEEDMVASFPHLADIIKPYCQP
ncbi:uncharacterized protein LOC144904041 isoform X2 [Branchiostoma floridae x Branchiostoma belcheri]